MTCFLCKFQDACDMNVHAFLDHVLGPQNHIFYNRFQRFLDPIESPFRPPSRPKNQCPFPPGTLRSASDFIKQLKNVKLSSKSSFSPQELPNWSQNTNMKWLKNMKLSSKSRFSPQEPPNLSQDTNMKRINPQQLPNLTQDTNMNRLNYVKLSSQSGFSPHELTIFSQDTITGIFVLNPFISAFEIPKSSLCFHNVASFRFGIGPDSLSSVMVSSCTSPHSQAEYSFLRTWKVFTLHWNKNEICTTLPMIK